jgi:nucleotide-binding universal stress UspA family protein
MQNILVPTDFSAEAHYAFEVAMQLAQRTGGHITLLHVVDAPKNSGIVSTGGVAGATPLNGVFMVQLLARIKRRMHELMHEVVSTMPEVRVQDSIATGDVDEAVLDTIREHGIDLVVVGAQKHAPATGLFATDSHAERLVRLAPCPVLTVKNPAPHLDVRSIVFASDFSDEADSAVPTLRQILRTFPDATLHLLDVVVSPDYYPEALDRIHTFAQRHELPLYEPDVFNAPKVRVGIPYYVEQAHADLVVMLTHGHTGLRHFLRGSIAESVAVQADAPVFTFHPETH